MTSEAVREGKVRRVAGADDRTRRRVNLHFEVPGGELEGPLGQHDLLRVVAGVTINAVIRDRSRRDVIALLAAVIGLTDML
jgi:hypothetical protein